MEISKIISSGEVLSPEQLAKVSGGTGSSNNVNNATVSCMCTGTGMNTNTGKVCQCSSNVPIKKGSDGSETAT